MDERTAQALEESIKHWEENVERAERNEGLLLGPDDCALCGLFWKKDCVGCPVSERTGKLSCDGSPYYDVSTAMTNVARVSACLDELNFLKSLREEQPKEKDTNMISKDKTYTTRDGREVRIYATDGGGLYPVHGAYQRADGIWCIAERTEDGHCSYKGEEGALDLIEAPVTIQRWCNVYEDDIFDLHRSRESADKYCESGRVACVPVTITYRPGEGLDNK